MKIRLEKGMVELKWIKGVMIAVFSEENPDDECWVMTGCSVARPRDLQSHSPG